MYNLGTTLEIHSIYTFENKTSIDSFYIRICHSMYDSGFLYYFHATGFEKNKGICL